MSLLSDVHAGPGLSATIPADIRIFTHRGVAVLRARPNVRIGWAECRVCVDDSQASAPLGISMQRVSSPSRNSAHRDSYFYRHEIRNSAHLPQDGLVAGPSAIRMAYRCFISVIL
jgi:hypothetical protein